jgi:hypothetical protein
MIKISILDNVKCSFISDEVQLYLNFINKNTKKIIKLKITLSIIMTPSKFSRILFDRNHNLIYPFDGYVLRDDLYNSVYNFDWTFESLDTNYKNVKK